MALTNLDYSVILTTEVKGITCKNVFWYQLSTGNSASAVADAFDDDLLPLIMATLSSEVDAVSTYAYNLVDLEDFDTNAHTSTSGARATDVMPIFTGWYFQYVRTTRATNHGRKTFAGIAEADVSDGTAAVGVADELGFLADGLGTALDLGSFEYAYPSIAHTVEFENPDNGKIYRVPDTLYPINQVLYRKVSTQNSRKR